MSQVAASPAKALLVAFSAILASCGSPVREPETKKEHQPIDSVKDAEERKAREIVDELTAANLQLWTERVRALEESLRLAVNRELGRRAIASGEDPSANAEKPSKEWEAVQVLLTRGDWLKGSFTDFLVWAKFHEGREGLYNLWMTGIRTFPSVLKLRRDRHRMVHIMVGYFIVEYVLGSFRGKSHKDAQVETFCRKELETCPEELRPHYRAMLAAIGDENCLDAIPLLIKSETVADWQYAHHLIEGMFGTAAPYTKAQMSQPNADYLSNLEQGVKEWMPINARLLEWWRNNRSLMSYDKKDGHWYLEKK